MKQLGEHFQDILVSAEYRYRKRLLNRNLLLPVRPDSSICFFRFLWKVSDDSQDFKLSHKLFQVTAPE